MQSKLTDVIRTIYDREQLISIISQIKKTVFTKGVSLDSVLAKAPQVFETYLQERIGSGDVEQQLALIESELAGLRVLRIEIAIEPTSHLEEAIHAWTLKNISENLILEIVTDPSIIAGAKISYQGKYWDFSVTSKVSEAIQKLATK